MGALGSAGTKTSLNYCSFPWGLHRNGKRGAEMRRDVTYLRASSMPFHPTLVSFQLVNRALHSFRMAGGAEEFRGTSWTTKRSLLKLQAQRIVCCHFAVGVATRLLLGRDCVVGSEKGMGVCQVLLSLQVKSRLFLRISHAHKWQSAAFADLYPHTQHLLVQDGGKWVQAQPCNNLLCSCI